MGKCQEKNFMTKLPRTTLKNNKNLSLKKKRHWARDWRALALTQVHHGSRLSDSCDDGEALSSVHSPALTAGKLIRNLLLLPKTEKETSVAGVTAFRLGSISDAPATSPPTTTVCLAVTAALRLALSTALCSALTASALRRALAAATVRLALAASALRSGVTAVYFRPAITTVVASGLDGGWWIRRVEVPLASQPCTRPQDTCSVPPEAMRTTLPHLAG